MFVRIDSIAAHYFGDLPEGCFVNDRVMFAVVSDALVFDLTDVLSSLWFLN